MSGLHFTHPAWLWLLAPTIFWVVWFTFRSHASIGPWKCRFVGALRLFVASLLLLALAGIQWLEPREGMNVMFLLDRSRSVPVGLQETAIEWINRAAAEKHEADRAGVLVFGANAGIEQMVGERVEFQRIQAVVDTDSTDIAAAIRLAIASLPEHGQKRLVLLSDGNENLGDAVSAVAASRQLDVSVDVVPLGSQRRNDVSLQRLALPSTVKKGTPYLARIFVEADEAGPASVSLYVNDRLLGTQDVVLAQGKNQLEFPQQLDNSGFYTYRVEIASRADRVAQNNRGIGFVNIRGDPRILVISDDPSRERNLVSVLSDSLLEVTAGGIDIFPSTLAELQSYDAVFLCNVSAGDLGGDAMWQLESAVRDFGVGLVCVGGDQAFAAGAYRGTPLERALPVDMDLSSRKVLPKGALAMIMHGMEFNNGNQVARKVAAGVLEAMGPRDELGVLLWDGNEKWLFPMTEVGDRRALRRKIMGMNQGDLPSFAGLMRMAWEGLRATRANLKHIIVFSDGDPGLPTEAVMDGIVGDRITVSTVLIAGHAGPEYMQWLADRGRGRFYNISNPSQLPRIFIKEATVILKSAISEEPFVPRLAASSEILRGLGDSEFPQLLGHVATTAKSRAEVPLVTPGNEPLLAHWNYGLGRAVAFTSDARAKWASTWLSWPRYRQFWSQVAQWALRRVENTDFTVETTIDKGVGTMLVEAIDEEGNFRNFLDLEARVVGPSGSEETRRLRQTAPGRYEISFPAQEVGAYTANLALLKDGQVAGYQMTGTSLNYSPEYAAEGPDLNLLGELADMSGGTFHPSMRAARPFDHDRKETHRPHDLWERFLMLALLLFPLDVAVRRVHLDREDRVRILRRLHALIPFVRRREAPKQEESLAVLLRTRDQVRRTREREAPETRLDDLPLPSGTTGRKSPSPSRPVAPEEPPESEAPPPEDTTTSRLLAAKKRVGRRTHRQ